MGDIDRAILEAWGRVRGRLLSDPEELARRLARRRKALLVRPPRAWCLAVRAGDRRINSVTAACVPEGACYPGDTANFGEHEVWIDAALVRRVCAPVEIRGMQYDSREVAEKLGVSQGTLAYGMRKGRWVVHRVKGLGGRRVWVPLMWKKDWRTCDPGGGNVFEPPDGVWGQNWRWLAENAPAGMGQGVRRVPVYGKGGRGAEGKRFVGWRWVCPGCGKRVKTIFYPRAGLTVAEFLGEEKRLVKGEVDGLPRPAPCWACHGCHGVKYWSGLTHSAWNHVVAYFSGGLLYGKEVQRPESMTAAVRRKRKYVRHNVAMVRGEEVRRLLVEGKSYAAIAREMGVSINTVQGHVRRVYRKYGVHGREELREGAKDEG